MADNPPPPVPGDAWWSETDREWVHGAKDERDRLVGIVRYWDVAGVLISETAHVAGKPHGEAVRFYPSGKRAQTATYREGVLVGPRLFFRPATPDIDTGAVFRQAPDNAAVYEAVYDENGDLIATRFRDTAGRELGNNGERVKRPRGVPETAGPYGDRWLAMRRDVRSDEILESQEWDAAGRLIEDRTRDGTERRYDIAGRLASLGRYGPIDDGKRRGRVGLWHYGDPGAAVRRESHYDAGIEVTRTWFQHGLSRTGAIAMLEDKAIEVGPWQVRDGERVIDTVDLGRAYSDAELLAAAAMEETPIDAGALGDLVGDGFDSAAICARIRLAARLADDLPLARVPCRPECWSHVASSFTYWHDGKPTSLLDGPTLGVRLAAARWGEPWSVVLERAGIWLFEHGRPHAALDFLDAATMMGGKPAPARSAALRLLGRDAEVTEGIPAPELARLLAFRNRDHREAAGDLADAIEPHARAKILRAFSRGRAPAAGDVRAFKRTVPKALRESFGDALRQGFRDDASLWLDAALFVEHADDVFRLWPCATELTLSYASGVIGRLATTPALARYRGLSLSDTYLFDNRAEQLAASRYLGALESLGLYGTNLYDEDLAAILLPPRFPRLRELELGNPREDQNYSLAGLRLIAGAAFAPRLERLGIARRYFDNELVEVIGALPRLHSLDAEGNGLDDDGLAALAALPHRFRDLDLERGHFGAEGIAALVDSPVTSELVRLDVGGTALGPDGFRTLTRLRRLEVLEVEGSPGSGRENYCADARFTQALADSPLAETLTSISLSLASIGPRGAHALAATPFRRLQRLNLYGNMIYDDGAIALIQSPAIRNLQFLDLGSNDLTDVTGIALAESPHADSLLHIELGGALLEPRTDALLKRRFGDRIQLSYPWARGSR
jgi:YD repeat-containing protein